MDIKGAVNGLTNSVSNSLSLSSSPEVGRSYISQSPEYSFTSNRGAGIQRRGTGPNARELKPFATTDIKILLLENVNTAGQDILRRQGYQVETLKASIPEAELLEKIKYVAERSS